MDVVGFCNAEENPPGPLQPKVAPAVEEDPFNVTVLTVQVIDWEDPGFTFGETVLVETTTKSVFEHPLEGSVTVKV